MGKRGSICRSFARRGIPEEEREEKEAGNGGEGGPEEDLCVVGERRRGAGQGEVVARFSGEPAADVEANAEGDEGEQGLSAGANVEIGVTIDVNLTHGEDEGEAESMERK